MSQLNIIKLNKIKKIINQTSCMHLSEIICTNFNFYTNSIIQSHTSLVQTFNTVNQINILVYVANKEV